MEVDGHEVDQQQYLNEKALYDVSSGAPRKHGRLAIANGAVKSSDVRAAGRGTSVRPSSSATMQNMSREIEELRRANERLQRENHDKDNAMQQNKVLVGLVLVCAMLLLILQQYMCALSNHLNLKYLCL
jgi:hypothetical protein